MVTLVTEGVCIKNMKNKEETVTKNCKHKDCKYRSTDRGLQTCSYILFKGEPRGCNISDCDKYEPRRRKRNEQCNENKK